MRTLDDYAVEDLGPQNNGEPVAVVEPIAEEIKPEVAEQVAEAEPETQEEEHKRRGSGRERKIAKLERQLEQALEIINRSVPQPQAKQAPVADARPVSDSYETINEYVEALTDWKIQKARKDDEAKVFESKALEGQKKAEGVFQERFKAAVAAHPDFQELYEEMADEVPITDIMRISILESENGHELMHYFLKHPDESKRIAGLGVAAAGREIGKLEARFETAPKPNASKAPAPPTPIKGTPIRPPKKDDAAYEVY
jgi:hypothetical protein